MKGKNPKSLVLNVAVNNKEDYIHVYKLCNNDVIFHKFRTWMDEEVNSAAKILENKLYLLNPLLTITQKQKGQPVIAYDTEPLQSSIQDI